MKKIISLILAVIMIFSSFSVVASAASTKYIELDWQNGRYKVQTDIYGKKIVYSVQLLSQDCSSYHGEYVMPSVLSCDGYVGEITSIKYDAFKNTDYITSITLPEYITTINFLSTGFNNVEKIRFYDNIDSIYSSFTTCFKLEAFEMLSSSYGNYTSSNDYFEISDGVLYEKGLKTLLVYPYSKQEDVFIVPEETKRIAENAFYGANRVKEIVILPGVTVEKSAVCHTLAERIHFAGMEDTWEAKKDEILCGGAVSCNLCNGKTEICFGTSYEKDSTCTEYGSHGHYCDSLEKWLVPNTKIYPTGHSFTTYVDNNDAKACNISGTTTAKCDNGCGKTDTMNSYKYLPHVYGEYVFAEEAYCQKPAEYRAYCVYGCGDYKSDFRGEKGGHIKRNDGTGNTQCLRCSYFFSSDCGHICHKSGFFDLIYRFCLFFWKLFKTNQVCDCGKIHY